MNGSRLYVIKMLIPDLWGNCDYKQFVNMSEIHTVKNNWTEASIWTSFTSKEWQVGRIIGVIFKSADTGKDLVLINNVFPFFFIYLYLKFQTWFSFCIVLKFQGLTTCIMLSDGEMPFLSYLTVTEQLAQEMKYPELKKTPNQLLVQSSFKQMVTEAAEHLVKGLRLTKIIFLQVRLGSKFTLYSVLAKQNEKESNTNTWKR